MPLSKDIPEGPKQRQKITVFRGRYVPHKKIAAGNFGTVYLVIDKEGMSDKNPFKVLKLMRAESLETDGVKREAEILARLNHENIVKFHESFTQGRYFCMITDYYKDGDMDRVLQIYKKKDSLVSENRVIIWLYQLLKALFYLHSKHILHRDLTPKNIFLKGAHIKLGCFMISKKLMNAEDMAYSFVGTPCYMSPEVIMHDRYNEKSDIWSLGCVLFQSCSLKHAFDDKSLMAVTHKICVEDIPSLPEKYSQNLNHILLKMLVREYDKRSSARELLQHPIFKPLLDQDPLHPLQNTVFRDRYKKDKALGRGSFGIVHRVIDQYCNKSEERFKVMKQVHVGIVKPSETIREALEADIQSKLDHDNIVKLHGSFVDEDCFCIIIEFCDGGDLHMALESYKKRNAMVPENQVIDWVFQLVKALFYLHSRNILHRDLKPKNIFLKDNVLKLGDFGTSRMLMNTVDMASTILGTPFYMSPEILDKKKYRDKCDIWSLGCILYEMCSLEHVFEASGMRELFDKICSGKIPELPQSYSRSLNNVLNEMLVRDQSKRASAEELMQHRIFMSPTKYNGPEGGASGPTTSSSGTLNKNQTNESVFEETLKNDIDFDSEIASAVSESLSDDLPFSPDSQDSGSSDSQHENFNFDDADISKRSDDELSVEKSDFDSGKTKYESQQNTVLANNLISSRIAALREACVLEMGEEVFSKAYKYLRDLWSESRMPSADEYKIAMKKLRGLVHNDENAFLLEQLVYLESEKEAFNP